MIVGPFAGHAVAGDVCRSPGAGSVPARAATAGTNMLMATPAAMSSNVGRGLGRRFTCCLLIRPAQPDRAETYSTVTDVVYRENCYILAICVLKLCFEVDVARSDGVN